MELQSLVSKSKMLVVDELFCIVQMKMSFTCTYWAYPLGWLHGMWMCLDCLVKSATPRDKHDILLDLPR
jgi:hypothetical protein